MHHQRPSKQPATTTGLFNVTQTPRLYQSGDGSLSAGDNNTLICLFKLMRKANVYSTLLIKPFYVTKFPQPCLSTQVTPLLQLKIYKSLPFENARWDFKKIYNAYRYDRILMLKNVHYFAVRRNKMINNKRQLCMKVLSEELGKDPARRFVSVQLNNILRWVPDEQLERHLRYSVKMAIDYGKVQIKRNPGLEDAKNLGLREIAINFEKNYMKWLSFSVQKSSVSSNLTEDSYNSIVMDSIYLYEYCPRREQIYEDVKVLQMTLQKFNFLGFFATLKHADHQTAVKCCERFLKTIKFREHTTQDYLLHYCKNHNIENLQMRIKLLVRVYEGYYISQSQAKSNQ